MQSAIDLHRYNKKRRLSRQIVCANVLVSEIILSHQNEKVNSKIMTYTGFVKI